MNRFFMNQSISLGHKHWSLLLLLLLLTGMNVSANEYAQGLVDIERVKKEAASFNSAKFPNSDDVLVDNEMITKYEVDGSYKSWDDGVTKVLTEKGAQGNKVLSLHYNASYTKAKFLKIEVIKPDGTVIVIDPEKLAKVQTDRSSMSANIYDPNDKILTVSLPKLEVGDMVRTFSYKHAFKARAKGTWADIQIFEYTSPINRMSFEVIAPKEKPLLHKKLKNEVAGSVVYKETEKGKRIHYRWEAKSIPRMFKEPDIPSFYKVVQHLMLSTVTDWQALSKWYWNISKPHFDHVTPKMKEKVKELIKTSKTRDEKIKAIFKFVSQEIRYMGITTETDAPGYEPHDVDDTFNQRHGVCRDKAALLVVMLREAGIKAFPVIIHNGAKKDVEVPQPFFNHAITAVENEDGSYMLMDSTDENTKDIFPPYLTDKSYIVAKPEGETLLTSPIIPAKANMMEIETNIKIDSEGNMTGACTLNFAGINDNIYRGYFARAKPQDRRKLFEGLVKALAAGATLDELKVEPTNMLDSSTPLRATFKFSASDVLVGDGTTSLLSIPRVGSYVGMVNFVLNNTGLEKRKFPMSLSNACGVHESILIDLAPELGVVDGMPVYPEIVSDALSWKRTLKTDGSRIVSDSIFTIDTLELSPKQYAQLKNTLKTLEVNARKKVILKKEGAVSAKENDVDILENKIEYTLEDAHNWTSLTSVKKRILTFAGKKDHGEIKLDYNPVWQEIKVVKAQVTTNGVVKEISEQEINLMDASWVSTAPRYPGAKTLIASLPAVEVGSLIEYQILVTSKNQPYFNTRRTFAGMEPVRKNIVSIDAPIKFDLDFELLSNNGKIRQSVTQLPNNRKQYRWEVSNQVVLKKEADLPPLWTFNPTVVATSGLWKGYVTKINSTVHAESVDQKDASALAVKLTANLKTDSAKLIAVRDYIEKNLRVAGPSFLKLPLTELTKADRTLKEGYGNSADVAILYYSMLKAIGFEAEFVLASSYYKYRPFMMELMKSPSASMFSHAIIRVQLNGRPVYLNDTNEYAKLGMTVLDGYLGLDLNKGTLLDIQADEDKRSKSDTNYDIILDAKGDAVVTFTQKYYGPTYTGYKKHFEEIAPEDRNRYFQKKASGISQTAVMVEKPVANFESYPGIVQVKVKVSNFAVVDGTYLYFNVPTGIIQAISARTDERFQSIFWNDNTNLMHNVKVTLPVGYDSPALAPEELNWQAPGDAGFIKTSNTLSVVEGNAVLEIKQQVAFKPALIEAPAYDELKKMSARLIHQKSRTVLLKK